MNIGRDFPNELASALSSPEAFDRAADLPALDWARCLRNAISHGGVAYLDANGRPSHGQPTEMLAFVSAIYPRGNFRVPPESLVALRITRDDYLTFLHGWVGWLSRSRLSSALAA